MPVHCHSIKLEITLTSLWAEICRPLQSCAHTDHCASIIWNISFRSFFPNSCTYPPVVCSLVPESSTQHKQVLNTLLGLEKAPWQAAKYSEVLDWPHASREVYETGSAIKNNHFLLRNKWWPFPLYFYVPLSNDLLNDILRSTVANSSLVLIVAGLFTRSLSSHSLRN